MEWARYYLEANEGGVGLPKTENTFTPQCGTHNIW